MLERVETLHNCHLIHRDIKPANFVTGCPGSAEQGLVYCIDFGLSKRYRHPRTLQHIPHRDGRSLTGTPRYASVNNHLGIEQSRRDDLESIGYVLVYFLKGGLPWQGLKARNAQKKYRMILEKKQAVSVQQLCDGLPSQFADYLAYCRSLKFDAKPNMTYLRGLFRDLYQEEGFADQDFVWDWEAVADGTSGSVPPSVPAAGQNQQATPTQFNDQSTRRPNTAAALAPQGEERSQDMTRTLRRAQSNGNEHKVETAGSEVLGTTPRSGHADNPEKDDGKAAEAAAAAANAGSAAPAVSSRISRASNLFRRKSHASDSDPRKRDSRVSQGTADEAGDKRAGGTFSSWFPRAWGQSGMETRVNPNPNDGRASDPLAGGTGPIEIPGGVAQGWAVDGSKLQQGDGQPTRGVVSGSVEVPQLRQNSTGEAQDGTDSAGRPGSASFTGRNGDGSYAVASARGMMRYRRSRVHTFSNSSAGGGRSGGGSAAENAQGAGAGGMWWGSNGQGGGDSGLPQRPRTSYEQEAGQGGGSASGHGGRAGYSRNQQGSSSRPSRYNGFPPHSRSSSSGLASRSTGQRRPKTSGGRPNSANPVFSRGSYGYGSNSPYAPTGRTQSGSSNRGGGADGLASGSSGHVPLFGNGKVKLGVQSGGRPKSSSSRVRSNSRRMSS
eukprot:scaffold334_cov241-Pinguiococcus_pyrenoidosus.AAC.22